MLILPESWDESKSVFKGEVDGFKIGDWEGRGGKITPLSSPLPPPLPLSLFSLLFKMVATINVPPSFR